MRAVKEAHFSPESFFTSFIERKWKTLLPGAEIPSSSYHIQSAVTHSVIHWKLELAKRVKKVAA